MCEGGILCTHRKYGSEWRKTGDFRSVPLNSTLGDITHFTEGSLEDKDVMEGRYISELLICSSTQVNTHPHPPPPAPLLS